MKWVKASEGLPNNEGNYFVKTRGVEENDEYTCGNYLRFVNTFQGKYFPLLPANETVIEWLDESPSTELQQAQEDDLPVEFSPIITERNWQIREIEEIFKGDDQFKFQRLNALIRFAKDNFKAQERIKQLEDTLREILRLMKSRQHEVAGLGSCITIAQTALK